ncbi:hypothetical protein HJG60_009686 [Phyllostomus discolor]|uniref:Uncharacterized protein n=1 Tax=Phyllostomus discolor TaxID=89673 RepID=A0A834B6J7_9CHIR|nr:hypothetical protein HJG60_009686 [Phyllostomus discolor]
MNSEGLAWGQRASGTGDRCWLVPATWEPSGAPDDGSDAPRLQPQLLQCLSNGTPLPVPSPPPSLLSPTAAATKSPNWGGVEGDLRRRPPAQQGCGAWRPSCGFLPGFRERRRLLGLLPRLLRKHRTRKAVTVHLYLSVLGLQSGSWPEAGVGKGAFPTCGVRGEHEAWRGRPTRRPCTSLVLDRSCITAT